MYLLLIDGCRWEFSPPSWFSGGALEMAPTTSGWSLASYASLLAAPFFVGTFQVQFAFFSVRPWKDGLSFGPVEATWLILQVRGHLRLVQNAIFFSWMRLRLLDAAVFNRRIFTLSLELASGRLPVPPFGSRFRCSDPWHSFFGAFPQMDERLIW
jgi:hypothetical protein